MYKYVTSSTFSFIQNYNIYLNNFDLIYYNSTNCLTKKPNYLILEKKSIEEKKLFNFNDLLLLELILLKRLKFELFFLNHNNIQIKLNFYSEENFFIFGILKIESRKLNFFLISFLVNEFFINNIFYQTQLSTYKKYFIKLYNY